MNSVEIRQMKSYGVKQSIAVVNLKKALDKDSAEVDTLLKGMERANTSIMEKSITPYKGANLDVRL